MTGDELRLEMKRETPEALSGRADFGIAGNRFTLGWLKATQNTRTGVKRTNLLRFATKSDNMLIARPQSSETAGRTKIK